MTKPISDTRVYPVVAGEIEKCLLVTRISDPLTARAMTAVPLLGNCT